MTNLVAAPVFLPLATGIALLAMHGHPRRQRLAALGSGVLLLVVVLGMLVRTSSGEILVLPMGSWSSAVGIVWVADLLAAIMLSLGALTSLATLFYSRAGLRADREAEHFYPLHQFLMVGVNGSFVTGDYFNLFVFFEIMLLSSFALISLGGSTRGMTATFPYVLVNLIASALLLGGVGAVYGLAGSVNMAEISRRLGEGSLPPAFWSAMSLVLVVFAIKTALAPVFFWLPDSYPEAPLPAGALFAGLLTKVGVYTLFRSVPLLSASGTSLLHALLLAAAGASMLLGVLGALGRSRIREILSFHIISQVGYMILGLALYTPLAVAAGIFYIIHHIVVKTALFFAAGIAARVGGSDVLDRVSGLAKTHPWVAVGFFVPAMALAGLPPFSGFWGKLFLIIGGFGAGAWVVTTIAIAVSFFTLASMLKIWVAVFWGAPNGQVEPALGRDPGMLGATLGLAALSLAIGFAAAPLFTLCERAADQLLRVTPYVDAVLEAEEVKGVALSAPVHRQGPR